MKFRFKVALIASSLLLSTLAFSKPPVPEQCPSVNQIRAEGLTKAETDGTQGFWILSHESQYGTPFEWEFILLASGGNTEEEAILNGNKILKALTGNPEPEEIAGTWGCMYEMAEDFIAFATVK